MTLPEQAWGKLFQRYASSIGRKGVGLSLDTRLLLVAIGRANNTGHAVFIPGELQRILGRGLPDGTRKPASRSTVYATLKKLREAGLMMPGGGETCVWLVRELWERQRARGSLCPIHRTYKPGYITRPDTGEAA
ncbi:hypothetical protein [Acrocarpospora catenulata]|uniref:hypothetical protein n=1 Tax=Acrocarpospora catenulata TaxID=2836182 RepID=UPI001BDA7AFD|nr:hypothetical protein [Acrocarpospora catenulata]